MARDRVETKEFLESKLERDVSDEEVETYLNDLQAADEDAWKEYNREHDSQDMER